MTALQQLQLHQFPDRLSLPQDRDGPVGVVLELVAVVDAEVVIDGGTMMV
jgi:hypothetical protein